MSPTLLSRREAAARVCVSERQLDRIIAADPTFPICRIGGRVLVPEEGFAAWLTRQIDASRKQPAEVGE